MKSILRAVAVAATAAAAFYVVKRLFARRANNVVKEAPWSKIMPAPLSDMALLDKAPYRAMYPLFWVCHE
jgi:hypothetical protein